MDLPGSNEREKYLWYITLKGALAKYGNVSSEVSDKIKHEMDVITGNGFTDYILIIWDIHDFCRTPDRVRKFCKMRGYDAPPDGLIPLGPGRGSVGGSMVCYVIDIHECDPLRFGLYFERFLNPERIAMPDIDFDISQRYRYIVLDYISWKYGEQYVSQIITYSTLSARSVCEEVLKSACISLSVIKSVKEHIPNDPELTVRDLRDNEKFMQALRSITFPDVKFKIDHGNAAKIENSKYITNLGVNDFIAIQNVKNGSLPSHEIVVQSTWTWEKAIDIMERLDKLKKHESVHSGGVVVAPVVLDENVPLMQKHKDNEHGSLATQYDMRELEELGYLKMDALGLRTVDVNHDAEAMVREWYNPDFDIRRIPYNDENALNIIKSGDTVGIFQVESSGFTTMMCNIFQANQWNKQQRDMVDQVEGLDIEIEDFMWVSAGLAMYRPGPLDAVVEGKTMVQHLIDRKAGKEPVIYLFQEEEDYLRETYGIMIYQEQVMARVRQMTGCTLGRADVFRKAMGKKNPVLMKQQTDWFHEEAMKHKFTDKELTEIQHEQIVERAIDQIEKFARYGFNKAHTVEYAHICYRNAYLKGNYPVAFYTALLNSEIGNKKRQAVIIQDMMRHNVKLLPPLISKSNRYFTMTDEDTIRFGLEAISGLGEKAMQFIINDKNERGQYTTVEEFRARVPGGLCNVNTLTNLAKCGAFDDMLDKCIKPMPNRASLVASIAGINDVINKAGRKKGKDKPKPSVEDVIDKILDRSITYPLVATEEDLIEYATWEKDTLNFFISAHPMDAYRDEIRRWNAIGDVEMEDLPKEFYVAGFVGSYHETTVKKEGRNQGKKMGFITMETEFMKYEATVFPGLWETFLPYLKTGEPVVMKGKRDFYKDQVSIQGVYMRRMTNTGIRDCPECHIRLDDVFITDLMELQKMFIEHPGVTRVFFHTNASGYDLTIETNYTISLNDRIIEYCDRIGNLSYKPN